MTEKWVGVVTINTQILADQIAKLQCPVLVPSSTFAHLQNQVGVHSEKRTQHSAILSDMDPQTKSFAGLEPMESVE